MTDPNGAAILMVLHGSHQDIPPLCYVSTIYSSTMDPSWVWIDMVFINGFMVLYGFI